VGQATVIAGNNRLEHFCYDTLEFFSIPDLALAGHRINDFGAKPEKPGVRVCFAGDGPIDRVQGVLILFLAEVELAKVPHGIPVTTRAQLRLAQETLKGLYGSLVVVVLKVKPSPQYKNQVCLIVTQIRQFANFAQNLRRAGQRWTRHDTVLGFHQLYVKGFANIGHALFLSLSRGKPEKEDQAACEALEHFPKRPATLPRIILLVSSNSCRQVDVSRPSGQA